VSRPVLCPAAVRAGHPRAAWVRLHALGSTPSLASPESRLLYRFPKPDIHGRTEVLLTPLELLDALAGKLTDYGRPHAPRVRLDELPRKPGHQPGALTPARAVANLQAQIVGDAITASKRRQNGNLT